MKKVFAFFIENYKLSMVLTVFLAMYGVIGFSVIRREALPPVNFAVAVITTQYPGSSPEEVEEKITRKIEDEVRAVSGVKEVTSVSQSGRSVITVRFEVDDVDLDKAMGDLHRAVQRVKGLPPDILENPVLQEINSDEIPIVELAVSGPQKNRERDKEADRLKISLEDVPGVSRVELTGFREREFQVLLDQRRMRDFSVNACDVVRAIRSHSVNVPAGYITSGTNQKLVRVQGQVKSIAELENIVIQSNFIHDVKISQIAKVVDAAEEPRILARVNGEPATLVTVTKKASADALETASGIENKIEEFKKSMPKQFTIIVFDSEAQRIRARLDVVVSNALGGLALVLLILLLFLPGTIGFVTALSLPLSIFGIVGVMAAVGINFNIITMLALVIALGMLVDNAVVTSENYVRFRQEGIPVIQAAVLATHQFWLPMTATVLITIAAFLPMLVTRGIMGQFIRPIPIVVTLYLAIALLEVLFLLPARLRFTLTGPSVAGSASKSTFFSRLQTRFTDFMRWGLRRRYRVFAGITLLLAASIALNVFGNRFELFPNEAVETYVARYEMPEGTTLAATDAAGDRLAALVRQVMGDTASAVVQKAGVAQVELSDSRRRDGDNVGMLLIYVPLEKARRMDPEATLSRLRSIRAGEFTSLEMGSVANGPPVGKALNITLRSTDYEPLRGLADILKKEVVKIPGVKNLNDDEVAGSEEYRVQIRYPLLAKAQLSIESVGACLRTALRGVSAATLNLDNKEFDLVVRYGDEHRASLRSLLDTELVNNIGGLVPLERVADVSAVRGPAIRKHSGYLRSITVSADIDPNAISAVVLNMKVRQIADRQAGRFPGVSVEFGGEEESTRESLASLFQAMVLAMFSIFAILLFLFRSFTRSLLVMSSIPLGLVGISWAFFFHGKPLSFLALIGVVGLAGIIVNSAIVLMSFIGDLEEEGNREFHEMLAYASGNRLRAVLITSLTTIVGLLPTAYGIGGYDPTLVPMTFALAWGLIVGTLLTIVWIPCGVAIVNDIAVRLRQGRSR